MPSFHQVSRKAWRKNARFATRSELLLQCHRLKARSTQHLFEIERRAEMVNVIRMCCVRCRGDVGVSADPNHIP